MTVYRWGLLTGGNEEAIGFKPLLLFVIARRERLNPVENDGQCLFCNPVGPDYHAWQPEDSQSSKVLKSVCDTHILLRYIPLPRLIDWKL